MMEWTNDLSEDQIEEEIRNKEKLISRLEARVAELISQERQYHTFLTESPNDDDDLKDVSVIQQSKKLQQARTQGQSLITRLKHECELLHQAQENNKQIIDQQMSFNKNFSRPTDVQLNHVQLNEVHLDEYHLDEETTSDNELLRFSPVKKQSFAEHDEMNKGNSKRTSYASTSYVYNAPTPKDNGGLPEHLKLKADESINERENLQDCKTGLHDSKISNGGFILAGAGDSHENRQNYQRFTEPKRETSYRHQNNHLNSSNLYKQKSSPNQERPTTFNQLSTPDQNQIQQSNQSHKYDLNTQFTPINSSTPNSIRKNLQDENQENNESRTSLDTTTSGSTVCTAIETRDSNYISKLQRDILKESGILDDDEIRIEESHIAPKLTKLSSFKAADVKRQQETKAPSVLGSNYVKEDLQYDGKFLQSAPVADKSQAGGLEGALGRTKEANPSTSDYSRGHIGASKDVELPLASKDTNKVYLTKTVSRSESQPQFITRSNNNPTNETNSKKRIHFRETPTHNFVEPDNNFAADLSDDDPIERLPLSSRSRGGVGSGDNKGGCSNLSLFEELDRLRKNNAAMQTVIDQLTEEIQLRDKTINDLESQIQQLSQIITTKQPSPTPGVVADHLQGSNNLPPGVGGTSVGGADTQSIMSDLSHMTSLTSSTVPIQPATLYQCTRCEEMFKNLVQFQTHITQCLERALFNKESSKMRRSRSAATSRDRSDRDRDRSQTSSIFPPKSQDSINNAASNVQSQESIITATSGTTAGAESVRNESSQLPTTSAATRSNSTSVLYQSNRNRANRRHIAETSLDTVDSQSQGQKISIVSTDSITRSTKTMSPNFTSTDIKKLPSQPILSYKTSPNYEELWPSENASQMKHSDSMRDTFGKSFDEIASSLRVHASATQQRPSSFVQAEKPKLSMGKKLMKSSSDAVYIPKELRPLRPKMPPPVSEDKQAPTASSEFSKGQPPKRSPPNFAPANLPPRGATLAAYHSTSPQISPTASMQRSPNGSFTMGNNNHQSNDRSRPLGPPPPIPKRGEDSKQKASEQASKRSARSRVKDAVKSPFSTIRRRMKSMSSLERIPRNKDIAKEESKRNGTIKSNENTWEFSNSPIQRQYNPNSAYNIPQQGYHNGPGSTYSPPQRAASFYGGSLRQPGSHMMSNPAMYRPLPPSPNTRFYNHNYKYSTNDSAARAFLHGTGTEV